MAKVRRIFGTAKKKGKKFWNKWLFYALKHKNEGLRNEKESNGIKRNDFAESFGIISRNDGKDCKNDQKRPEMTGNDRRISLRFCYIEEWIPRKFPDFPCIFLENSPIFSDFPRNSPIFSEILWFSPIIFLTLRCFYIIIYIKVWKEKNYFTTF